MRGRSGQKGDETAKPVESCSTGFAELDGSSRTGRVLQDSTVLAELDGFCRTRRFLQNSTGFAGLDGSCRQNSTVFAELNGSCRTLQVLPFRHPFGRYGASYSRIMSSTMSGGKPRTVSRKQLYVSDKPVDRLVGSLCSVVKRISSENDI